MYNLKTIGALFVGVAVLSVVTAALVLRPFGGSAGAEDEPGVRVAEAGIADGLDDSAALAFSDGRITRDEYAAAMDAAVACIRDAGYPVIGPTWTTSPEGVEVYGYSVGPFDSKAALDESKPVHESCYVTHARGVDVAWQTAQQ